jgi:hypothetical protein
MYPLLLDDKKNGIDQVELSKSEESTKEGSQPVIRLTFKIVGELREAFHQKSWEKAYNLHDNVFRMKIVVELKSHRRLIHKSEFVRKAILFWTRSPKIPHRIWASIVEGQTPFYPQTVEEARSFLFDVNKEIQLNQEDLKIGTNNVMAYIRISWGKHQYTEQVSINATSNEIEVIGTDQKNTSY